MTHPTAVFSGTHLADPPAPPPPALPLPMSPCQVDVNHKPQRTCCPLQREQAWNEKDTEKCLGRGWCSEHIGVGNATVTLPFTPALLGLRKWAEPQPLRLRARLGARTVCASVWPSIRLTICSNFAGQSNITSHWVARLELSVHDD